MAKEKKNWLQRIIHAVPPAADQSIATYTSPSPDVMEKVLITGDLANLTPPQRLNYYESVCRSLGLNPLTKPFEYIVLNGKLTLYPRKDCTEQLRRNYGISLTILSREIADGLITVTARALMPNGRQDESVGSVPLPSAGEAKANAMMKAETKAKRRVTLSICGLGMFDEIEMEPGAVPEMTTAEDRVKQATSNAQPSTVDAEIIPEINEVTEENYGEVICHIGKAQGDMLSKKVSDIHPKILDWLQKHFGPGEGTRWGNPPTPKDDRLKAAVDIGLQKLNAA
jgi:hypothetical protein